jgi:glyoxylase-like metal-dependent hydrolase (beta-lactamase superfamily II)
MEPRLDAGTVERIEFDIEWPPGTAFAYLLVAEEPILVDAGSPGETGWNALASGISDAGYAPEEIEHLLVTHPHTDHAGQAATLLDAADPTVYAPVGVRARLSRDVDDLAATVRRNATAAGVPDVEAHVDRAVDSLRRNRACLPPERIDVEVAPGERFSAGDTVFEAVHVPGHQENQAAFLTDGLLFAGDAAVEPFRPAALHVGFDEGHTESIDAFYEGLSALSSVEPDVERVYPGHGPVFEDLAGAVARDRESLDSVVADCRAVVESLGVATVHEVTAERVGTLDGREYTVFESVGALARLRRQGVLDAETEEGVHRFRPA